MRERVIYFLMAIGISAGCYANEKPRLEYKYIPLVREGVEWVYRAGNLVKDTEWLIKAQFAGTTEIDGVTYHNLYQYECELDTVNESPLMYMREVDKKVYRIARNWEDDYRWGGEELYYDFTKSIGDTLKCRYYTMHGDKLVIMQRLYRIDDSYVKGSKITFMGYDKDGNPYSYNNDCEYVEGIGFMVGEGTFYDLDIPKIDDGSYGPCFLYLRDIEKDEIIYPMNGRDKIDCPMVSVPEVLGDMVSIENIRDEIILTQPGNFEVMIYDLDGKICGCYKACDELRISTIGMAKGVYIVHLTTSAGTRSAAKFTVM